MYECIRCGHQRNSLTPRIGDKFTFGRKNYVEGASSWCNFCSELTFFIKSKIDCTLDLIESASTSRKSLDIQNSQGDSMAKRQKNWAVEAVDPPKNGASFTILPNRNGYLNRNLQIPRDNDARPPVTPLNVSLNSSTRPQTDKRILGHSSQVKKTKKAEMVPRAARSPKVKGIELLRSTPPKHLSVDPDRHLSPVNPYKMNQKHRDERHQKSGTSNRKVKSSELYMGYSGPGFTLKDIKKLQRHFAADDSEPGTSRQGSHVQSIPRSEGRVLNSSHITFQKKLIEKRRQVRKLASMRTRLNVKYQTTLKELDDLESRNHRSPTGRSKRQSGGAHITLSRLVSKMQIGKRMEESRKLLKEGNLETLLKALGEDNLPFLNGKNLVKDQESLQSLKPVGTRLTTETEMESVAETVPNSDFGSETETHIDSTSSAACESVRTRSIYIPLPRQQRNSFASPAKVGYYMPSAYHPKDYIQQSQPLATSPRLCTLVSSAQRALCTRIVNDPLDIVRLIRSMDESTEVSLNAPRAQFSTIACAESELLRLIEKKPYVTRMGRAKELDVSRSPVRCPDHDCQRLCFVSDFNIHMMLDHRSLTMERIKARHSKTFFLDTNMTMLDKAKCHMVYMVRDKVIDTHGEDLNDLFPVMVMSGRTHLSKTLGHAKLRATGVLSRQTPTSDIEIFVIWLTGFIPRDIKPLATISLWSTLGPQMADCVSVNTSYVYDIRAPTDVGQIARSRCSMILPMSMITKMTNNARRFLAVQVQVY
ncbi:uncharacterized protein LOC6534658 [Drosophila yakuba]|uniref:DUF4729 domain-containing protein n=1 Tax=Drosophila yakuba TaxID=7245 RepID=B4PE32_DROYA|nr:uncharacterized protein LOC6534658 [Drosophila yakuba]EDW95045.2 uncharacterized protein Dyak_GE19750 [Drosophila yakuba]